MTHVFLSLTCVFVGYLQLWLCFYANRLIRGPLSWETFSPRFSPPSPTPGPQWFQHIKAVGRAEADFPGMGAGISMCLEYWTAVDIWSLNHAVFLHTSVIRTSSKPIKNQTNSMNIQWPRILIIVMNINAIGLAFSSPLSLPSSFSLSPSLFFST